MINKQEIQSEIRKRMRKEGKEVLKQDIDYIVNETFNIIMQALEAGEEVSIRSFGRFKLYDVKEHYTANPLNKQEKVKIERCTRVSFQMGKELKDAVNNND